jgi:hypothetical protein
MERSTKRPFSSGSEIYGAQLRAIADEIDERFKRLDYMTAEEITTWLRSEADRAEAQP